MQRDGMGSEGSRKTVLDRSLGRDPSYSLSRIIRIRRIQVT